MVSIIPKPKNLILQPGALKLTLPLTIYGNMGTESTIDRIAAQLGDLALINNPESQAQISLNLREETFRELGTEGYKLDITPATISILAARTAGLFYAWQTLRQLLPARIKGSNDLTLPCLSINDKPRFPWRGFMLDEARHFFGMDTVKRVLDWLAFIKINTFHWHLTDYQGWRIEIKKYPKLSEVGSIRAGSQTYSFLKRYRGMEMIPHQGWYTQSEVQEIIAYAAERHITIVPEFDLPGHFSAVLAAYPHLSCTKEPIEVRREWGVFEDVACVGSPETRQFLKDVLDEFCTIFPGHFIHLGGDEVRTDQWETCPQCRRVKRELDVQSFTDLNSFIMNELGIYLLEKGKTPVVWNEALKSSLNKNIVVMHWTPSNSSLKKTIRALKDGRKVVFQTFRESYYDYPHSFVPLKRVYRAKTFDEITSEMIGNVLGTQGALWTEFVSDEKRIQFNTFPRLAAKAEVGWSPDVTRDYQDFQQRWQNLVPHMKELALINSAPLEVWDPSLYRQAFARFLDMRVDMQGEQKRWESKTSA